MLNAMQIASLYAKIGADTSQFDSALRGSDKALQSFGGKVGAVGGRVARGVAVMGAAVAASMAATAAAVTVAGFKFNNLSQQGEIAFTTMLGSADKAKAFLADLQEFAARTPFEYASLMSASQKMLAMGFKENDILPTLTAIGDAVAALGGGQEKIDRVTIALGQMQAKGKASAEEMMQLTEAGIPAWEMLASAIGVEIPEAMKMVTKGQVNSGQAIEAIVAGMNNRFSGMMEKQSKTFGGMWSTIMDTFQVTAGKVTKPLFDATTRVFARIIEFTNTPQFTAGVERLTVWFGRLTEWAERTAETFTGRFMPALRGVSAFVAAIPNAWKKFREIVDNVNDPGLHKTLNGLRASFAGLGKVLGSLARPFKDAFGGLFQSLMVARGSGWSGIFDVLTTRLMKAVSQFGAALSNEAVPFVLGKLKELGGAIKGWVDSVDWGAKLKEWAGAFKEWAGGVWAVVQPKLKEFWNWLSSWVTDETKRQTLWDAIVKGWTAFTDWAGKVWDWVKTPLGNFWNWLTAWVTDETKRKTLVDAVVGGWTAFTEWAGAVWDAVKTPLGEFWGWLSSWVTDPAKRQTLTDAAVKGWTAFADWAGGVWDAVSPKLDELWTSLKSWVTDPAKRTKLLTALADAWTSFTDWAGKVWGWAKPKLGVMWTSLSSWVTDPAKRDELRNKANGIWTGFTDWAGSAWSNMKPKLDTMLGVLKKWIDENVPSLGSWIDAFIKLGTDVKTEWKRVFPEISLITSDTAKSVAENIKSILDSMNELKAWFTANAGVDTSWGTIFLRMAQTVGFAVQALGQALDSAAQMLVMWTSLIEALKSGDIDQLRQIGGRFSELMDALNSGPIGDLAKWTDPLYWLGMRPEGRAAGGRSTFGGMTWVGERGPELVNLPGGSHVYTNAQSTGMAARGGRLDLYVHGESSLPADRGKIRELAAMLQRELQLAGGRVLAV